MALIFQSKFRNEHAKHVCNLCGRLSEDTICEACAVRVRAAALAIKKHRDKGEA
jgi:hypothetical protein